jgi:hypothetical protein
MGVFVTDDLSAFDALNNANLLYVELWHNFPFVL